MAAENAPEPVEPVTPEATGQQPEEVSEALDTLREYATPVLVGVLLAVVVVGGYQLYRSHKRSVADRASAMLTQATSVAQLQELANVYVDTPSAAIAQLAIASGYFADGNYEQAQQNYARFLQTYPEHTMAPSAKYGLAMCLEATGYADAALDAFEQIAKEYPDHFLSALAQLGKGRCLHQLGRLEDARVTLENFIAENPGSPWTQDAESLRLAVDRDTRTPAEPPAAPPITGGFDFLQPANP